MQPRIFVSYSHEDDSIFKDLLKFLEPVCRAARYRVSSDRHDLSPGDDWDSQIKSLINDSNIVVLLVSQNLLNSDYVTSVELPLILTLQKQQRTRLFWVPIGTSTYEITGLEPYQCAAADPNRPVAELSGVEQQRAWKKLTSQIMEYARRLTPGGGPERRKVYLCQHSPERVCHDAARRLNTELADFGYDLTPGSLSSWWKDAEPVIHENTANADLMVALIGEEFPPLAQGYNSRPGVTLLELEDQIAAAAGIPRMIWIPSELKREGAVEELACDIRQFRKLQPGYEWRESHLQDLVEDVHSALKRKREDNDSPDLPRTVYLICSAEDHPAHSEEEGSEKVRKLKEHLETTKRQYSVLLPPISTANLDDILEAESFVFYWGGGDPKEYFWTNLQVFEKAVGKRAAIGRPFRARVLYLTDPKLRYKSLYPKNRFTVIEQYGNDAFHPDALDSYL